MAVLEGRSPEALSASYAQIFGLSPKVAGSNISHRQHSCKGKYVGIGSIRAY